MDIVSLAYSDTLARSTSVLPRQAFATGERFIAREQIKHYKQLLSAELITGIHSSHSLTVEDKQKAQNL